MIPDERLIDANALDLVPDIHNAMNGVIFVNHPRGGGRTQMIVQQLLTRMISNAPTIDAVEVVHGRWILERIYRKCSLCEWIFCIRDEEGDLQKFNYCPNCGIPMDGGADK